MSAVLQALGIFLAGTVVFDGVHWLLHRLMASRVGLLRAIGGLHATHHRFLDRELRIHDELLRANLLRHVVPEYLTHLAVSGCALLLLPAAVVLPVVAAQTLVFLLILRCRGKDVNHRGIEVLRAYRPMYFCVPAYHALHHVHPDACFSSWIKTLDHLLGTGLSLAGRRVTISGADGPFGAELARLLRGSGAKEVRLLDDPAREEAQLRETDVLVLCRGAGGGEVPEADGASLVDLVERFASLVAGRRFPVEVWALAPPGAAFAGHARRWYGGGRIIYRHIALPGARPRDDAAWARAARVAFFFLRRGFNYVPAAASGRSLLDFLRFRLLVRPAPWGLVTHAPLSPGAPPDLPGVAPLDEILGELDRDRADR